MITPRLVNWVRHPQAALALLDFVNDIGLDSYWIDLRPQDRTAVRATKPNAMPSLAQEDRAVEADDSESLHHLIALRTFCGHEESPVRLVLISETSQEIVA
jgi:hypothetical protein